MDIKMIGVGVLGGTIHEPMFMYNCKISSPLVEEACYWFANNITKNGNWFMLKGEKIINGGESVYLFDHNYDIKFVVANFDIDDMLSQYSEWSYNSEEWTKTHIIK